jgi:fructoselysine-6-P-deglycase FrlB-like protein
MDYRRELYELPGALRETLEKGGPEYDRVVRQTRWGDGPVYLVGSGGAYPAALAGACAIEALVGIPAQARTAKDFQAYSISVLRPRAILLVIAPSGESADTLEVAHSAKSRGATVLALTSNAENELSKLADGVFLVRSGDAPTGLLRADICRLTAATYVGFVAGRALKRPYSYLHDLQEEFQKLPDHVEWGLTQISEAIRAFASELRSATRIDVTGGGFYHPAAWHTAAALRKLTGIDTHPWNALSPETPQGGSREVGSITLLLSGSRCRGKKHIHTLAESEKRAGRRLLAITDKNDPELSRRSALALLMPVLCEEVGSILSLSVLDWVACHVGRESRGSAPRA